MDDLFSVPLGTIPPNEPEESVGLSPIPPEATQYRGKWIALRCGSIVAVRDSRAQLRDEFGAQHPEVTFFHVPASEYALR